MGETLAECTARYGPMIEARVPMLNESTGEAAVFSRMGVTILVEFHNSVAWRISFKKPSLHRDEMQALLQANTEGTWSSPLAIGGRQYLLSVDGGRLAILEGSEKNVIDHIVVMNRECLAAYQRQYGVVQSSPGVSPTEKPAAGGGNPLPGF